MALNTARPDGPSTRTFVDGRTGEYPGDRHLARGFQYCGELRGLVALAVVDADADAPAPALE